MTLAVLLLTLLACTGSGADPEPATTGRVPTTGETASPETAVQRILLVVIDTTRADHLTGWGYGRDTTPAMAAFGAGARVYANAHAHAPWTKPSMATLFSSQLPAEHGLLQWNQQTPEGLPTLATALQQDGWRTEAVVVQEAFLPQYNRFEDGFDRFDTSVFEGIGSPEQMVTSEQLTDRSLEVLTELNAETRPWLLWVHYFDPHMVYADHSEPVDWGSEPTDRYDEEIGWVDAQLSRLLAAADDRTLVVVMADHGEELLDHGGNGHTRTVYQELVHVPLMLKGPGVEPGIEDAQVGLIDVAPTLLAAAGVAAPDTFRGHPLLPEPVVRPIAMETRRWGNVRGILDGGWKITWDLVDGQGELYDLAADPGEHTNRWDDAVDERERLLPILRETWPEVP